MLRILIWLGLLVAVWWWLRRRLFPDRPSVRGAGQRARDRRALAPPEAMIDCAHCGLHLPASKALRDAAGRPFCCAEHRDAGPARQGSEPGR